MNNFYYFALQYLNDWCKWDSEFIKLLSSNDNVKQLQGIRKATIYYKIRRNFKKIEERERLSSLLEALQSINGNITNINADEKVIHLSNFIKNLYGNRIISAASKLLWLKFKSPIIIYDARTVSYLKSNGAQFNSGDYTTYRKCWKESYKKYNEEIMIACKDLHKIKKYSLANNFTDYGIKSLAKRKWFRERIFDKFLWSNAE